VQTSVQQRHAKPHAMHDACATLLQWNFWNFACFIRVLVMESWPGSRHVKNLRLCRVNAKDLKAARHKSRLKAGWLKDQKSASFTGLHHSKRFKN